MGKSIQDLRKAAGYSTAREFASACGFSPSSLARYEKDPVSIPVKSAWTMADMLGCTVDDVIGRESEVTADLRGDIQIRYDALPASLRSSLDDYLAFLETREGEDELPHQSEIDDVYMDMLKLFLVMFMEGMEQQERDEFLIYGAAERMRDDFQRFMSVKIIESCYQDFVHGKEVVDGVMRAYDRFYPKPRESLTL